MDSLARDCNAALASYNGHQLAATISPVAPPRFLNRLESLYHASRSSSVQRDISQALARNPQRSISQDERQVLETWTEIYTAYWHALGALITAEEDDSQADWGKVYETWKDVANAVIRGYSQSTMENWTLPVLYLVGKHLRSFAIKADESKKGAEGSTAIDMGGIQDDIAGDYGKNVKLEDAARVLNRMFTLCISDRAPLEESRKWGLYYVANLLFKTYFKLNSVSLSKNILRAIFASTTDMPDLASFPKSHIVTFKYYLGLTQFLQEDYNNANESFTSALNLCHRSAHRNKSLILIYLVPTRLLLNRQLPSAALLRPYPALTTLFMPIAKAIRSGSLSAFDAALEAGEATFVKRRIYLSLERGRDICLRNLLRKVYQAAGTDAEGKQRTRIKVDEFAAAIRFGESGTVPINGVDQTRHLKRGEDVDMSDPLNQPMDNDEVECLLANLIYKNLMKGYISRQHGIVVLSKQGAFPGTGI